MRRVAVADSRSQYIQLHARYSQRMRVSRVRHMHVRTR